ncbi:MAG: hypothetical protein ACYC67_19190 [Prosthecobacter sp.]
MSAETLAFYEQLRKHSCRSDHGAATHDLLLKLVKESVHSAARMEKIDLVSRVNGKTYFALSKNGRRSRAINHALFSEDADRVVEQLTLILQNDRSLMTAADITSSVYSAAIAFCACIDILKDNDQKTPGTFFEYLCAAIMRAVLDVPPQTSLSVLNLGLETSLPTDLIFDLGAEKPKFHVPVKTSTRERVIQVWAHQRVLDGVYGTGRFLGLPLVLAETKTDSKSNEVTEICLPKQWRLYQMHIAQMWRIAYLDMPAAYAPLSMVFPPVPVVSLGSLLTGLGDLTQIVEKHREPPLMIPIPSPTTVT